MATLSAAYCRTRPAAAMAAKHGSVIGQAAITHSGESCAVQRKWTLARPHPRVERRFARRRRADCHCMADQASQLFAAAGSGDVAGVRACLAAGADANAHDGSGWAPLHDAANEGHFGCVAALIAGGAEVDISGSSGCTPLHMAASEIFGDARCVQLLLAAGAKPLAVTAKFGWTPLHYAAAQPTTNDDVVWPLLQAAPAAALVRDFAGHTPLTLAIWFQRYGTARYLMQHSLLPPASDILDSLATDEKENSANAWSRALYPSLVSRQPLTAEEWGMIPTPCTGLGAALHAVLGRSAEEAGLLVGHLPAAEQQRLCTAALCLARAQRQACAPLPTPIMWRILVQSALPA